jgi:hypothetical protein
MSVSERKCQRLYHRDTFTNNELKLLCHLCFLSDHCYYLFYPPPTHPYHITSNLIPFLLTSQLRSLFDFDLMGDEQYGAPVKGSMDESRRYCAVMCCTPLYCSILCCAAQYCIVQDCTVLYCTVLHCLTRLQYPRAVRLSTALPMQHTPVGALIKDSSYSLVLLLCVRFIFNNCSAALTGRESMI